MSDDEQEYEVESVTRAIVHDKRGKKLTWKYYVKWKGYGWNECTWEPAENFTAGAKHLIKDFWERADTGGRDFEDAVVFKKGEEVFVSGPPGKKGLKRKKSATQVKRSPTPEGRNVHAVISTPLTTPRKRRKVQIPYDDILEEMHPKYRARIPRSNRRTTTNVQTTTTEAARRRPRRRASSPGPRKPTNRRLPSLTNSELDAEGEIDPDLEVDSREVEDALMQSSAEDADELSGKEAANDGGAQSPRFDDLQHFYSGQPIDIEQATSEEVQIVSTVSSARAPGAGSSRIKAPVSPRGSPLDPLFDSPPYIEGKARELSRESSVPFHRARAANPLIKRMDPPTQETSAAAIPAKARLMTNPSTNTAHVSLTRGNAKRGGKPGPGRSSAGLLTRNRSSLLTASKGKLTTVKGKFVSTKTTRDKSEQIEVSPPLDTGDIGLMAVSSMEEGVNIEDKCHGEHSPGGSHDLKPSETGLLKMAGVEKDANPLPDFDEDPATHDLPIQELAQEEQIQASEATTSSAEQAPATATAAELVATSSTLAAEQPSGTNTAVALEVTTIEDVAKKNLALATEQLFPSAQKMSFQAFSEPSTSFRSTIFGPLYQGTSIHTSNSGANDTGSSTSFKIIVNDTISIPLTLKDVNQMKGRMSDLRIGKSVNGRAGNFYGQNDALAIISALRSCGTARVVPEESADTEQQEHFATFLRQFELGRTFISAVGVDVYVLYLSENAAVVEQFSTPANLVGLSNTLLVARASIENQSVYAQAAYAAQAVVL